jgi:hypothetical protein
MDKLLQVPGTIGDDPWVQGAIYLMVLQDQLRYILTQPITHFTALALFLLFIVYYLGRMSGQAVARVQVPAAPKKPEKKAIDRLVYVKRRLAKKLLRALATERLLNRFNKKRGLTQEEVETNVIAISSALGMPELRLKLRKKALVDAPKKKVEKTNVVDIDDKLAAVKAKHAARRKSGKAAA